MRGSPEKLLHTTKHKTGFIVCQLVFLLFYYFMIFLIMADLNISIFSPAKINLFLKVKERRPDGFHNIDSFFLALDFGDTLHFEVVPYKNTVEIMMEGLNYELPIEKNIIFKAISLFRKKTGLVQGLKVRVKKRIPIGGGLGGGSSNAASTLLALNRLNDNPLSRDTLLEMATCLGSDVSFFVYETTAAWVTGRGEKIEPCGAEVDTSVVFVLVNPGFPSDTAAAYKLLDESRFEMVSKTFLRIPDSHDIDNAFRLLETYRIKSELDFAVNDFMFVFKDTEKTVYDRIISELKKHGAVSAGLSGTGSTCFGLFTEGKQAEEAAGRLRGKWGFAEAVAAKITDKQ